MYNLKAESRNTNLKVKKLREEGIIPGCVYGGSLKETLLIQLQHKDVIQLLKLKTIGGQVVLNVKGKKILALLKEINLNPVTNRVIHLSFQNLIENEFVTSTALIILANEDKITDFIRQSLFDISYKALPSHIVEEITIDMEGMKLGSIVRVEDLEIAKNKDIEILIPHDTMIINIVEQNKGKQADEVEDEEVVSDSIE